MVSLFKVSVSLLFFAMILITNLCSASNRFKVDNNTYYEQDNANKFSSRDVQHSRHSQRHVGHTTGRIDRFSQRKRHINRSRRDVAHVTFNSSHVTAWPIKRTANIEGDITLGKLNFL